MGCEDRVSDGNNVGLNELDGLLDCEGNRVGKIDGLKDGELVTDGNRDGNAVAEGIADGLVDGFNVGGCGAAVHVPR